MLIYNPPRLRTPVMHGIAAVLLFGLMLWRMDAEPDDVVIIGTAAALGFVFAVAATATGAIWFGYERNQLEQTRRQTEAISPLYLALQAAARLTPEQAAIVNHAEFKAAIGMATGNDDPLYFLITRTGNVPLAFVDDFLRSSSMTDLRAVRTYSEGTPARSYAQAMTDWCVAMGLATPANGPRPAQWIDEHSKARAFSLCDLEWIKS